MLAVFPLTTATVRRWWNYCHSLTYQQVSLQGRSKKKAVDLPHTPEVSIATDWKLFFFNERFWSFLPETFWSFVSVLSKLAITVFISLYFQTFWLNWLNFFQSFQKHFSPWLKKNRLKPVIVNTLRTGVRYIRSSISAKKQQFSVALPTP